MTAKPQRLFWSAVRRIQELEGHHAEGAATYSWRHRDGAHVGSSVVHYGRGAEVGVWHRDRRADASPFWTARRRCRGHILGAPRADRGSADVWSDVASALCSVGGRGRGAADRK